MPSQPPDSDELLAGPFDAVFVAFVVADWLGGPVVTRRPGRVPALGDADGVGPSAGVALAWPAWPAWLSRPGWLSWPGWLG